MEHAGLVPHGGNAGNEACALLIGLIAGGGVAQHVERRLENHVEGQLAAARALAHGLSVALVVVGAGGVAHGALGEVHGAHRLAYEGQQRLVAHLVVLINGRPLHLLQPGNGLEVEHIGPSVLQPGRRAGAVKIDKQAMLGGDAGGVFQKVHNFLVVAVHKVDFETLDAHFCVVGAHPLDVACKSLVAGPQHEVDPALAGIGHQLLKVDFGHHLHQVGLFVYSPSLIENHIFNAVAGRKVDVVAVGVVVNTSLEVNALQIPGVPPVPSHLARLYP